MGSDLFPDAFSSVAPTPHHFPFPANDDLVCVNFTLNHRYRYLLWTCKCLFLILSRVNHRTRLPLPRPALHGHISFVPRSRISPPTPNIRISIGPSRISRSHLLFVISLSTARTVVWGCGTLAGLELKLPLAWPQWLTRGWLHIE